MKKRLDKPAKGHTAITFISGSAGEVDWVLPILDFLLNKDFNLKIIFLTKHARKSVEKNRMLNDFICQENSKVEVILCGGYFFEKVERLGYLSYRFFIDSGSSQELKIMHFHRTACFFHVFSKI